MEISGVTDTSPFVKAQPVLVSPLPQQKAAQQHAEESEQHIKDKARMQMMVEDIQRNLSNLDVSLTFSTYGKNNSQVSIMVVEKATGKVIREIPSKELQSLYTKMQEVVGMIFEKRA